MVARRDGGGTLITPTLPVPPVHVPMAPALPPDQLVGIEEFAQLRNWVSFDPSRGRMVCRNLSFETEEFVGTIRESRVVRVMKDEDGEVLCASSDRLVADEGRLGKVCEGCEDQGIHCFPRWWIAWQETDSGLIFAHTLSQTGSLNFNRYANGLLREGIAPGQVITRIYVEEAKRQKSNTLYRRVQFERTEGPTTELLG